MTGSRILAYGFCCAVGVALGEAYRILETFDVVPKITTHIQIDDALHVNIHIWAEAVEDCLNVVHSRGGPPIEHRLIYACVMRGASYAISFPEGKEPWYWDYTVLSAPDFPEEAP